MIARDHNRASVILWSMSNETPVKPDRLTFLTQLAHDAREMDSTRLITSAMNHVDETGPDVRTLSDPLGDVLDVLGLNEYLGWYWRTPGRCRQAAMEVDVEQAAHCQRIRRRRAVRAARRSG